MALAYLNQSDEAIAAFSRAIALNPTALQFGHRGLCYYDRGKYKEAEADFDSAIKMDPTDKSVVTLRNDCQAKLK
jgi:tetratricopeptide (TPR) repeat protein